MRIDIHNHCKLYSPCSELSPEDIIEKGIELGIEGIAFTDHDAYFDPLKATLLQRKYHSQIKIFTGTEITVGKHHVLQFGDTIPTGPYRNFNELFTATSNKNCALILAHPTRWDGLSSFKTNQDIINFFQLFDAIEVRSANIEPQDQEKLIQICLQNNIAMTAGSDAHKLEMRGLYATQFTYSIESSQGLSIAIKNRECIPIVL